VSRITPFLWFDGNAEEVMSFYVSVFKNSKVVSVSRRAGLLRAERWPAIQFHSGHLVLRQL